LSSGTRINSAKDDAAGYGISESVRGTKNIVDQNIRNAQNAISFAQVSEGALDVVGKILQRALTLSTQYQDNTLNAAQKLSITNEVKALDLEITNITARTKLQAGTGAPSSFTGDGITVNTGAGSSASNLTAVNPDIVDVTALWASGTPDTIASVSVIEGYIASNATNRGLLGASINSLEYAIDNMQTLSNNLADGISRIVDTDYAAETSNLTRTQILQQAATSMLAQANQMPNVILTLLK
jgi:flagellin